MRRYRAPELITDGAPPKIRIVPNKKAEHACRGRQRHRHGPAGADRQSRHHRTLRHQILSVPPDRGQGRRQSDRPVRRRLLCGVHGGRAHRRHQPPRRFGSRSWIWSSSGGSGFEIAPAGEEDAARVTRGTEIVLHLKKDAAEISRDPRDRAHRPRLFRQHPVSDRTGAGGGRAAPDQFGERAVAAAEIGTLGRRTTSRPISRSPAPSTSRR